MKKKNQTEMAKNLRRNQSDAEKKLWSRLRNTQLNGVKFRRQQSIGDYIVDFISFEKNLVVEVDGGQHNESVSIKDDQRRTRYLESRGYRVIRFWNTEVLQNIEGVVLKILESLKDA
jgi:very-short-patch-repair endonuclease